MKLSNFLLILLILISMFSIAVVGEDDATDPAPAAEETSAAAADDSEITWDDLQGKMNSQNAGFSALTDEDINNCMDNPDCKTQLISEITKETTTADNAATLYSTSQNIQLIQAWINARNDKPNDILQMYSQVTTTDKRSELGQIILNAVKGQEITEAENVQAIGELFCASGNNKPVIEGMPAIDCAGLFAGATSFTAPSEYTGADNLPFTIDGYGLNLNNFAPEVVVNEKDKTTYPFTLNLDAEGRLVITPPEKAVSQSNPNINGVTYSLTETFTRDGVTRTLKKESDVIATINNDGKIDFENDVNPVTQTAINKHFEDNKPMDPFSIFLTIKSQYPDVNNNIQSEEKEFVLQLNPSSRTVIDKRENIEFTGGDYVCIYESDNYILPKKNDGKITFNGIGANVNLENAQLHIVRAGNYGTIISAINLNYDNTKSSTFQGKINDAIIKHRPSVYETTTTTLPAGNLDGTLYDDDKPLLFTTNRNTRSVVQVESVKEENKETSKIVLYDNDVSYVVGPKAEYKQESKNKKSVVYQSTENGKTTFRLDNFNGEDTSRVSIIQVTSPAESENTKPNYFLFSTKRRISQTETQVLRGDGTITISQNKGDQIGINIKNTDDKKDSVILFASSVDRIGFKVGYNNEGKEEISSVPLISAEKATDKLHNHLTVSLKGDDDKSKLSMTSLPSGNDKNSFTLLKYNTDNTPKTVSTLSLDKFEKNRNMVIIPPATSEDEPVPPSVITPPVSEPTSDSAQPPQLTASQNQALQNKNAKSNLKITNEMISRIKANPNNYDEIDEIRELFDNIDDNLVNQFVALAQARQNEQEIQNNRNRFTRFISAISGNEGFWGFGQGTQTKMQNSNEIRALENSLRALATEGSKYEAGYSRNANYYTQNANWYNGQLPDLSHRVTNIDGSPIVTAQDQLNFAYALQMGGSPVVDATPDSPVEMGFRPNPQAAGQIYKSYIEENTHSVNNGLRIFPSNNEDQLVVSAIVNYAATTGISDPLMDDYLIEAISISSSVNNNQLLAVSFESRASFNHRKGNINKAKEYYETAISYYNRVGNTRKVNELERLVRTRYPNIN